MKQFFPMRRSEKIVLPFLIAFAAISFLPVWRNIEIGGMAVFGWLMAILMLISPVLTLLALSRSDKTLKNQPPSEGSEADGISDSNDNIKNNNIAD
jgi:hypothetical protein